MPVFAGSIRTRPAAPNCSPRRLKRSGVRSAASWGGVHRRAGGDMTGITVDRWPHGNAPGWNPPWEDPLPVEQQPNIIGRARFGRIAIANSDSGAAAYNGFAIDRAFRAARELLTV